MPLRIVKTPVQVFRDGKFVAIEPSNEPVEFTAEEVASINEANQDALGKVVIPDEKAATPAVEKKA